MGRDVALRSVKGSVQKMAGRKKAVLFSAGIHTKGTYKRADTAGNQAAAQSNTN